jgi:Holliday junction resolvase RusA-like endonuclease
MVEQATTLEFEVPLPPVALSPNGRVHFQVKREATYTYRRTVMFLAHDAMRTTRGWRSPLAKVRVSFEWGLRDKRPAHVVATEYHPKDADNAVAASKALIDGLVDAGIVADDKWACLELGQVSATFSAGPWVKVRIEAIEAASSP